MKLAKVTLFGREIVLGLLIWAALIALKASASDGILERFEKALAENAAFQLGQNLKVDPSNIQVSFQNLRVRPALPQLDEYKVQILGLGSTGSKRLDGLFQFVVSVDTGSFHHPQLDVSGIMMVVGPAIFASKNLPRGHAISEEDLFIRNVPWKFLPAGAAGATTDDLLGQSLRAHMNAGDPLHRGLIEEPSLIKLGDAIELTLLSGPGVIIRSRGIARGNAKMGERVKIEQPDTKKLLSGVVTGLKSVEVRL